MTNLSETYVVIYHERDRGFEYEREGFTLPELGVVPNVGDFIVDPGIPKGKDRAVAANHTVLEVTRRYFKPTLSDTHGPQIVLVVKDRVGEEEEADILYR